MPFDGFPRRVRSIPVPSPVFGPLLEEIDDLDELKCTLRVIWLLQQKKGYPRFVTLDDLLADRTLVKSLSSNGNPDHNRLRRGIDLAVKRGSLVSASVKIGGQTSTAYTLNSESEREALSKIAESEIPTSKTAQQPWEANLERANIFSMYEANIGVLSPMIAERLQGAEELYPAEWIEDAFQEAVAQNKRSWRYIEAILERWDQEGRNHGEPGRHPKKAGYY